VSKFKGKRYSDEERERALFVYIESFYNTRRIHTSLGKSPLQALKELGPPSPSRSQGACGDFSPAGGGKVERVRLCSRPLRRSASMSSAMLERWKFREAA